MQKYACRLACVGTHVHACPCKAHVHAHRCIHVCTHSAVKGWGVDSSLSGGQLRACPPREQNPRGWRVAGSANSWPCEVVTAVRRRVGEPRVPDGAEDTGWERSPRLTGIGGCPGHAVQSGALALAGSSCPHRLQHHCAPQRPHPQPDGLPRAPSQLWAPSREVWGPSEMCASILSESAALGSRSQVPLLRV